ncbi:LysR substrate-binding domain-containing protein [Salipiger abyssi]|uniref:Transcriptional regulator n=1 Tax=Salipiger abyssi TaxID=1250539 RepID=A0A1P8UMH4_9RHOB|nr:LysR substrate-binding domain-containing protein [Salipiger abyssi]APZ50573.1 transcriptional regulator [Salipiger abyssi]
MINQNDHRRARRLTPAISALAAFEAVVRNGSFTVAAEELALTQSAVSRQVSGLEQLLGVALLEKNRRRQVVVTASGAYYAEQIRQVLTHLAAATTEAITLGDRGGVLRLGIPPTFGSLWLIPRMPSFFQAHPNVTVEFSTRLPSRPHSGPGDLHALIDFTTAPGPDAVWEELIQLELRAVATEEIADAIRRSDKGGLANVHALLHTSERSNWLGLFGELQLDILRQQPLLTFENYTMLLQAAVRGLGVALAPNELIENDLSAKRLVHVSDLSAKSRSVGYLVFHQEMSAYPPLVAFREWLHDTMKEGRPAVPGVG